MHRLQELVRLYREDCGVRERARLLKMSTRTERKYRSAIASAGLLEGAAEDLPSLADLRAAVETAYPPPSARQVTSNADPWMAKIRKDVAGGAGPTAIWDKLKRTEEGFDCSLSSVKRAVRRIRKEAEDVEATDVAIPVVSAPGEIAQVDFGYAGRWLDPSSGTLRRAWVFVMVLAHCRHMFAKLVFDQKSETWLRLHLDAFAYFGGVPLVLVPDNLKSAVVKAAFGLSGRQKLALNRSYRELARYCGFRIDPTPPYRPQTKGKVESGVKYVKNNFLKTTDASDLIEGNADLLHWLEHTAGQRIHGTTGRRPAEAFVQDEQHLLQALPRKAYRIVVWHRCQVHRDSHVLFDGRLYSVPWKHLGRAAWVCATPASVKVFIDDERVATHPRRGEGRRSTLDAHLPIHRRDLRFRSITYWYERAAKIGAGVELYVRTVYDADPVLSRLREVQAIVLFLETVSPERAQAACARALHFGNLRVTAVARILERELDRVPLPTEAAPLGALAAPRFARPVSELLPPGGQA